MDGFLHLNGGGNRDKRNMSKGRETCTLGESHEGERVALKGKEIVNESRGGS